ncbi:cytochrome b/b6 domain-containing protein [Phaeobacter sp. QD34_3]|uniref:cytochrome b/b6 domain-containing protein n=1 Tax=unclassified Phaeobacter TaxID=2621772 RepID=UPI00237EF0F7|nr:MULTISPECIES: cytochrome b/b6 domain-containing protein [unclassified Phaeobacter]MDE4132089.1 cytochrome b/b6 domain-containing protein [Phaeobacter sp. QD34_3]MDE4135727.1 cytochrome b/b6 domain-containing protein [Phaeobacter sp. QD34_24]MDE4172658.1 cytochrome b/b6 domain-containing protein [Phaeobacter sp. PT47_59]
MPARNTFSTYGSVTKAFHWLTALLIFSAFPLGYFANELAHHIQSPDFDGAQSTLARAALLFSLHKTVGVAVFFTALLRILWAVTQEKPGLLHPDNRPEALAAETVHWALYISLVAVPLSGWIHHAATTGFAPILWPFGQSLPFVPKSDAVAALFGGLHEILIWALAVALALHIAGALKHHVIDRDSTLRRMLPGSGQMPEPPAQHHSPLPAFAAIAGFVAILGAGTLLGLTEDHSDRVSTQAAEAPSEATVATAPASSGGWTVEEGTLSISILQMGSEVTGQFADWSAVIDFEDPAAPGPAGEVDVTIAIPSLSLGSVTDQAMGADYFDSATYPTARFKAMIEKTADGYQATGPLTIRDQSVALTLPFDLTLDGDRASMSGRTTVNRLDFNIGQGTQDEGTLAFAVEIAVELTAKQNK